MSLCFGPCLRVPLEGLTAAGPQQLSKELFPAGCQHSGKRNLPLSGLLSVELSYAPAGCSCSVDGWGVMQQMLLQKPVYCLAEFTVSSLGGLKSSRSSENVPTLPSSAKLHQTWRRGSPKLGNPALSA